MIILHAAGNEIIGIGNLARVYNLAQYLIDLNEEVQIICEAPTSITSFFVRKNVKLKQYIVSSRAEATNVINNISANKLIYITDLIDLTEEDNNKFLRRKNMLNIHINDALQNGFIPDILIDEDPFEKYSLPVRIQSYKGIKYKIFNKDLLKNRPKQFMTKKIQNVLICFGGSDPAQYTEYTLEVIKNICNLNITIILGPGFTKERKRILREFNNSCCKIYENVNNMLPLIQANDMIISLGGLMAYEATLMGKVSVAIRWKHMGFYVQELAKLNLLHELKNIQDLQEFLGDIKINEHRLINCATEGYHLIDGLGGYRVREIISKFI